MLFCNLFQPSIVNVMKKGFQLRWSSQIQRLLTKVGRVGVSSGQVTYDAYASPSWPLSILPQVSISQIKSGVSKLCRRRQQYGNLLLHSNNFLSEKGIPLPKATSTGTTIVGCLFKDGIVLGADTRATEGPIVADKNCEKVRSSFVPL